MKTLTNALLLFSIFSLTLLFQTPVRGQTYQKHPRAMELERQMTKDALDFLKSRFPDYPVIVTVSIDPVYRVQRKENKPTKTGEDESLPFFRSDDEEILDEWDDPTLPNSVLLSRVKKIVVNVSVPGHLTDDEVAEIKQSLTLNLNLLPARDTIEILKRSWGQKKEPEFNPMTYIWAFLGGLFFFFIALLIAIWTPMRQISKILKEGLSAIKNNSSSSAPSVIMPMAGKGQDGGGSSGSRESASSSLTQGDVRFSDPIKLQTAISLFFTNLQKTESFPCLDDLIFLDKICKENPFLIGAFIFEANMAIREKIFSFSYGNHWLEALYNPGAVDIRVYEIVHKLNRMPRPLKRSQWDYLMILIWRLDDHLPAFLKSLNQAEAFTILSHLPKGLALKTARLLWPGSWANLLDPNYKYQEFSQDRVIDLVNKAIETFPLRNLDLVAQFKQDKDLMEFLGTVDPLSEREIYVASPKESLLHQMRPPFYKLFETSDENVKIIVESVPLEDLALALTNVAKSHRKKVEAALGPKQKIRFFEFLSRFESGPENLDAVGSMRDKIAGQLHNLINQQLVNERPPEPVAESEEDGNEKAA